MPNLQKPKRPLRNTGRAAARLLKRAAELDAQLEAPVDHLTTTRKPMLLHDMPWRLRLLTLPPAKHIALLDRYRRALVLMSQDVPFGELLAAPEDNVPSELDESPTKYVSTSLAELLGNSRSMSVDKSLFKDKRSVFENLEKNAQKYVPAYPAETKLDSMGVDVKSNSRKLIHADSVPTKLLGESSKKSSLKVFTNGKYSVSNVQKSCLKKDLASSRPEEMLENSQKMPQYVSFTDNRQTTKERLQINFRNFLAKEEILEKSRKMLVSKRLSVGERLVSVAFEKSSKEKVFAMATVKETQKNLGKISLNERFGNRKHYVKDKPLISKLWKQDSAAVAFKKSSQEKVFAMEAANELKKKLGKIPLNERFANLKHSVKGIPAIPCPPKQGSASVVLDKSSQEQVSAMATVKKPKNNMGKLSLDQKFHLEKSMCKETRANPETMKQGFITEALAKKPGKRISAIPAKTEPQKKLAKIPLNESVASDKQVEDIPANLEPAKQDAVSVFLIKRSEEKVSYMGVVKELKKKLGKLPLNERFANLKHSVKDIPAIPCPPKQGSATVVLVKSLQDKISAMATIKEPKKKLGKLSLHEKFHLEKSTCKEIPANPGSTKQGFKTEALAKKPPKRISAVPERTKLEKRLAKIPLNESVANDKQVEDIPANPNQPKQDSVSVVLIKSSQKKVSAMEAGKEPKKKMDKLSLDKSFQLEKSIRKNTPANPEPTKQGFIIEAFTQKPRKRISAIPAKTESKKKLGKISLNDKFHLEKSTCKEIPANPEATKQSFKIEALAQKPQKMFSAVPATTEPKEKLAKIPLNKSVPNGKKVKDIPADLEPAELDNPTGKKYRKYKYTKPTASGPMRKLWKMALKRRFSKVHHKAVDHQKRPFKNTPFNPQLFQQKHVTAKLQKCPNKSMPIILQPTQQKSVTAQLQNDQPVSPEPLRQESVTAELEVSVLKDFLGKRAPTRPVKMSLRMSKESFFARKTSEKNTLGNMVFREKVTALPGTPNIVETPREMSSEEPISEIKNSAPVSLEENLWKNFPAASGRLENPKNVQEMSLDELIDEALYWESNCNDLSVGPAEMTDSLDMWIKSLVGPSANMKNSASPSLENNCCAIDKAVQDASKTPEKSVKHQEKSPKMPLEEGIAISSLAARTPLNFYRRTERSCNHIPASSNTKKTPESLTKILRKFQKISPNKLLANRKNSVPASLEKNCRENIPALQVVTKPSEKLTKTRENSLTMSIGKPNTKRRNSAPVIHQNNSRKNIPTGQNVTETREKPKKTQGTSMKTLKKSREMSEHETHDDAANLCSLIHCPSTDFPVVPSMTEPQGKWEISFLKWLEDFVSLAGEENCSRTTLSTQQVEDNQYLRDIFRQLQEIRSFRLQVGCHDELDELEQQLEQDFAVCCNQFVKNYNVLPNYY